MPKNNSFWTLLHLTAPFHPAQMDSYVFNLVLTLRCCPSFKVNINPSHGLSLSSKPQVMARGKSLSGKHREKEISFSCPWQPPGQLHPQMLSVFSSQNSLGHQPRSWTRRVFRISSFPCQAGNRVCQKQQAGTISRVHSGDPTQGLQRQVWKRVNNRD